MPQTDGDKLKAFVQKMHNEGAAGFAAGPWSMGEGSTATGPTVRRSYHSRSSRGRRPGTSIHSRTDRILNGVAMLSIAAIIVGISGIYLTEEPDQQHLAAEAGTVQTTLRQADGKQLREIRHKLLLTTNRLDSLAAEFRRLKRRANTTAAADVRRLQALENSLVLTVTRLDTLSAEVLDLKQINNTILAATTATPPAAIPRAVTAPDRSTTHALPPPQATPVALFGQAKVRHPGGPMTAPQPEAVAAASPAPETVAVASPEPASKPRAVAVTSPAPEQTPEAVAAASPAPEKVAVTSPEPVSKPRAIVVTSPTPEQTPEAVAAASPAPETVASPEPAPKPQAVAVTSPVSVPETPPSPAGKAGGDWVVNIASYSREKTANRHVTELQRSGIDAERVEATVDGRHMHRVRVTGLASRAAARSRAGALKQELGLPGIWIGKR